MSWPLLFSLSFGLFLGLIGVLLLLTNDPEAKHFLGVGIGLVVGVILTMGWK
jgi:hypothetical protein